VQFRPFAEAREFVHKLGLKNVPEWREFYRSGKKPDDIPSTPEKVYEKEWKGYGDWLGTGRSATKHIKFPPFEESKKIVQPYKFKSNIEYKKKM
jgi:hypothetical protein